MGRPSSRPGTAENVSRTSTQLDLEVQLRSRPAAATLPGRRAKADSMATPALCIPPVPGSQRGVLRAAGDPGTVAELLASDPVFIQQLALIEASHEYRIRAVRDFLRASATKTEWGARGFVFKENLGE